MQIEFSGEEIAFFEASSPEPFPCDHSIQSVRAWLERNRNSLLGIVAAILDETLEENNLVRH